MRQALGLIETKGYAGNVEAADAMVKAADVGFIKQISIGAGFLTTIVPVSYTHLTLPTSDLV